MRHVALCLTLAGTLAVGVCGGARAAIESLPPLALRGTNPRWISGGVYSALAAEGRFGGLTLPPRARADGVTDLSKGKPTAVLDARVGANIRLGDDPSPLSAAQRGQAEPHLARSVANPDVLLATFQEGRFATGGGSADCGYALSRDGGLTWTRALIPQLTATSGGLYRRATDPVAGIGPQGDLYLTTLASLDDAFNSVDLVVSRSTDGGVNWSAPVIAFHQTTAQAAPDKNWLAVNDYPGAANPGRLVATWTNFTSTAAGASTGNNLLAAVSDDRGATWTATITITPTGSLNQGSQPLFLPDGSLVVIYATFVNNAVTFAIQCKRSTDGGLTFPATATTAVTLVNGYDDPDLRNGLFLPSATVARTTGEIFVTYVAVISGTPRVMMTKSSDQGATWTTPVVASDNPAATAVDNPAIAVTPDGQAVSILFLDKRNSSVTPDGHAYFIDHYAAQSFDGGATWQPNLRLSEMTSDVRYAALTSEGYMLGDYLAIAPSLASDQPCVPIWCDTRAGDADPFTVRFAAAAMQTFETWRVARFTRAELADSSRSGPAGDLDGDGLPNVFEYAWGLNPRSRESGFAGYAGVRSQLPRPAQTVPGQPPPPSAERGVWMTFPYRSLQDVMASWQISIDGLNWSDAVTHGGGGGLISTPDSPALQPGQLSSASYLLELPANENALYRPTIRLGVSASAVIAADEVVPVNSEARLINLSSRGPIAPGGGPMIAGFVTRGGPRTLLVRGVGPSLANFGITNFAADPSLVLWQGGSPTPLAQNDNWQASGSLVMRLLQTTAAQVGAFPLTDPLDAALGGSGFLPANYSAQIRNVAASGGSTGLVEIYDASPDTSGLLVNLSTLGQIGPPDGALIAGFVLRGTQPRRLLIRAVGPSLAQFGVANTLVDPVLTLYQGNTVIARNDDWEISRSSAAIAATAQNVGAFALNPASLDAALLITLAPGNYTAVVTGANGATGTALVEVYDAN